MKKLFILFLLLTATHVMAQDVIVKKDGTTINSKVLEITTNEVKYKKFSNLDGPIYNIAKSDIKVIKYQNGEEETFEAATTTIAETTVTSNTFLDGEDNNKFQQVSYQELLNMSGRTISTKKIKTLKTIGWVGGSILFAGGVILMVGAESLVEESKSSAQETGLLYGSILAAGGVAWTSAFLLSANHLKKKYGLTSIYSVPLIQKELTLKDGSSLAAGIDLLNDSRIHSQTLGIGLRYQF